LKGQNGKESQGLRKSKKSPGPRHDARTMDCRREAHAGSTARVQVRGGSPTMKLTKAEIDFLSAWAREEWEPECYQRPAHRLQLAHQVTGAHLIVFIKAWTEAEGKKDQDILQAAMNQEPSWPWSTMEAFRTRLEEARKQPTNRQVPT